MRWEDGPPRFTKPVRVEGGLRARSERGAIGESWWSKRFLAVLESFALGTRLTRGRAYARAGQVLSLEVRPGRVDARVQGSRPTPYRVSITLAVFDERTWLTVEERLAEQAIFGARLLAGDMPTDIETVFADAGAPLFPAQVRDLGMTCSCPDYEVPCKHLAATFYLLAESFDADPFQILHWRGRERSALLARLAALRSGGDGDDEDGTSVRGSAVSGRAGAVSGRTAKPRAGTARRASAEAAGRPSAAEPSTTRASTVVGAAAALADLAVPGLDEVLDRFWNSPVPLPPRPPTVDADVDVLLRQLPTPPLVAGGAELLERLRLHYDQFATLNP
jgi:uncharacterized Zn finger protein